MRTRFQQYLLPGIIFQSVLIGGAYATGREIVEYGARFGPSGLWSVLAIFIGFTLSCALTYEFARIHRVYDYRAFVKRLIGRLWPLFDALFLVMVVVIIAVVSAAAGRVVEEILGWSYWLGVLLVMGLVGFLNFRGREAIERFKTVGTVVLYAGYWMFSIAVLVERWDSVGAMFAPGQAMVAGDHGAGTAMTAGLIYVGYCLAVMPSTLFVLDRQTERRQAIGAGLVSGLLATIPFALTYVSVMAFYPDENVLSAPVPWLAMLRQVPGGGILAVYGVVVLWTLVETSTGLLHAIADRISASLEDAGLAPLTGIQVAALTAGLLLLAAALSRLGLIALVAKGYGVMSYGFLLLFALPLVTLGLYDIVQRRPSW